MCSFAVLVTVPAVAQERVRIATFNTELEREGPGLLLRDISRGGDPHIEAVLSVIVEIAPDILVLQGIDWDLEELALIALKNALSDAGHQMAHSFSARPNRGWPTGMDIDGDGKHGEPEDAHGFGRVNGQGGGALLSRYPIEKQSVKVFSDVLWRDVPGADLPTYEDGSLFPSAGVYEVLRLSTTVHWSLPVLLPDHGALDVMTWQASPPVFDGPEDMNGRRNSDETRFWSLYLDGAFGGPPAKQFVIAGGANLDALDGDGRPGALRALIADRRLQDPRPQSLGASQAGDQGHLGGNSLDTVDWPGPGRLRVDYILPSAELFVAQSGVYWPPFNTKGHEAAMLASRHRLVWVDLLFD
mgnify:CR=1 FL=1